MTSNNITSGIVTWADMKDLFPESITNKPRVTQEHINALWNRYIKGHTLTCYDTDDGVVAARVQGVINIVKSYICYITALPELYDRNTVDLFQQLKTALEGCLEDAKEHFEKA